MRKPAAISVRLREFEAHNQPLTYLLGINRFPWIGQRTCVIMACKAGWSHQCHLKNVVDLRGEI